MIEKKNDAERVVVTDFSKLKENALNEFGEDPFMNMNGQVILIGKDGHLFIDEKSGTAELLRNIWKVFLQENIFTLLSFYQMYKDKYPDACLETLNEMEVDEKEKMQLFTAFLVPVELKRRATEREYFGF